MNFTKRAQKEDEKKRGHLFSFPFSFLSYMVLKMRKIVHFLQICAEEI